MNPNQPNTPLSVDYLNQITPQAPKKRLLDSKQLVLAAIVGGLLLIAIVGSVVASSLGSSSDPIQRLAARLQTTATIANDAQSKLKSTDLRSLNSTLSLNLINTNRDIVAQLTKQNLSIATLNKTIVASEDGSAMTKRLEDARLNAIYDRTYAREMSYQLETISALIDQIQASTSDQGLKAFLQTTADNLQPTQKAFSDFNAANG